MIASSVLILPQACKIANPPAHSRHRYDHRFTQRVDQLRRRAGLSSSFGSAFIKAMGYSDDALERPIIGITNTFSDYNPATANVPDLIESVKRGVTLAGGLPMVFLTISIGESFAHPTSMFLRNLMAMDTGR